MTPGGGGKLIVRMELPHYRAGGKEMEEGGKRKKRRIKRRRRTEVPQGGE